MYIKGRIGTSKHVYIVQELEELAAIHENVWRIPAFTG
jgi:hypothetical protein